ncbi:MAG: 50S ribosomal protein L25 [Bacteroidota bacterium]
MSDIALNVQRREPGRKIAKQLRREGFVPGVFYMNGVEPIAFSVHPLQLRPIVYTRDTKMVQLHVEGESAAHACVLKDITFDPITDKIVHFDLHGVSADKMMHVEVPINLTGISAGVRAGGLAEFVLHKIEVECLPGNMPEHIDVDVTNLEIGDSIHVSDLKLDNMRILTSGEAAIVTIVHPEGATTGDDQVNVPADAEPELVDQKGKDDDE